MKILLLGGTGAMGSHLSEIINNDKGNDIVITSRKTRVSKGNISYVVGNAHDKSFLDSLLNKKWDVIVDFMVYNTDEFKLRVKDMLDSCNQYVFLSSSRVYANSNSAITEDSSRLLDVTNDSEYLATDEYALTKARQENVLKESGRTNWTIIRPYITFAENRLQLGVLELEDWLYRALLGHTIVFSEDIAQHFTTLTYGYDVARGIAAVMGNEKACGRAFHITVSNPMKWEEILEIYIDEIEKLTGNRPKVMMVKEHPYIKDKSRVYQVIYDRRFDRRFDNSAIREFIDTSSFLSTYAGLRKSLKSFISMNKECKFNLNASHEGRYDRITNETMSLIYFNGIKPKLNYIINRYIPFAVPILKYFRTLVK